MILGAVGRPLQADPAGPFTLKVADTTSGRAANVAYCSSERFGAGDARQRLTGSAPTGSWLAFSGNPLLPAVESVVSRARSLTAADLLQRFEAEGLAALAKIDGQFAIAWWNAREGKLRLIRDRFGMEPLHYAVRQRGLLFATRAGDAAAFDATSPRLSMQALAEYLAHCYLPGDQTLYDGIDRVPAGGSVEFSADSGALRIEQWYRLSYAKQVAPDERAIADRYRDLLDAGVTRRLSDDRIGVFISGGMDSSSAATFARRHLQGTIRSYSFKCVGGSADESPYSRALAAALQTQHCEVEFGEQQALEAVAAAGAMDMPFCDIGVEIGTWLLTQAAGNNIDYLLTGDGGDEIWASHPVYALQRIISWYDRMPLPRAVRSMLVSASGLVRDSDKKRNLAVILKRMLPDASYAKQLLHYRWKMYYTTGSLRDLVVPGLQAALDSTQPFQSAVDSFAGYDGPADGLSACLYSDYRGISSCYFQRMFLARHFGIEVRMPFYDRDLVEFGAQIPLRLKLEGIERTKRLFRMAMEGILPDIINHRGDKMGHSVPFKSWLRESGALNAQVSDTLGSARFLDRGLFRPEAVERLLQEHRTRRHNHSHRIWALFILEHWFRRHFDSASAATAAVPRLSAA